MDLDFSTRDPRRPEPAGDPAGSQALRSLARTLSELAQSLRNARSQDDVLTAIVTGAVMEIAGADCAGIMEVDRAGVRSCAASDPLVAEIDAIQHDLGEGPCVTSMRDHVTLRVDDLRTDGRWPQFAAAATERGISSSLSVRLYVADATVGALNLYSFSPAGFDDDDEEIAKLLAAHAAVAMRGRQIEADLQQALSSRDVIGQAKGILMERLRIEDDKAFAVLVMASQRTHRKLREVAEELTRTGDLRLP